eukprot:1517147-Amphidinium_carterae.1
MSMYASARPIFATDCSYRDCFLQFTHYRGNMSLTCSARFLAAPVRLSRHSCMSCGGTYLAKLSSS